MIGFTFYYDKKDVFVVTKQQRRTKSLCAKILQKMGKDDEPRKVAELFNVLRKAECTYKTLSNGKEIYKLRGDNFNVCGFVDDDDFVFIRI